MKLLARVISFNKPLTFLLTVFLSVFGASVLLADQDFGTAALIAFDAAFIAFFFSIMAGGVHPGFQEDDLSGQHKATNTCSLREAAGRWFSIVAEHPRARALLVVVADKKLDYDAADVELRIAQRDGASRDRIAMLEHARATAKLAYENASSEFSRFVDDVFESDWQPASRPG